jgi:hypothetical protein
MHNRGAKENEQILRNISGTNTEVNVSLFWNIFPLLLPLGLPS